MHFKSSSLSVSNGLTTVIAHDMPMLVAIMPKHMYLTDVAKDILNAALTKPIGECNLMEWKTAK